VAGWKAIMKLGLFIITMDHDVLIQTSFEEILGHLSESPKKVLYE
jgi:hypothetical protein